MTSPGAPTQISDPVRTPQAAGWDRWLLATVVALVVFGLVAVMSASLSESFRLYGSHYGMVARQLVGVAVGLVLSVPILLLPWVKIRRSASGLYILVLILFLLTASPLGKEVNGAQRWLSAGLLNLQASELAKPVLALFLADLLSRNIGRIRQVAVPISVVVVLLPLLVLAVMGSEIRKYTGVPIVGQSDLGVTVEYACIGLAALWVSGLEIRMLVTFFGFGSLLLIASIVQKPYRLMRIQQFIYQEDADLGFQVEQGFMAMGSGGWTGVGIGQGLSQVPGFTPEAHTDMIAAVIAEEMGVVGWTLLVGLQLSLLIRGLKLAGSASTLYDVVVASAVSVAFGLQTIINLGVVVGVLPSKGLVLPFITYGASAMIANIVMVALLIKIGTHARPRGGA